MNKSTNLSPLALLRDYTKRGETVSWDKEKNIINFSQNISFPGNTNTAYRSSNGTYYTLATLILFLEYVDKSVKDYLKAARKYNIPFVSVSDKKDLIAYLRGEISTSSHIDLDTQFAAPSKIKSIDKSNDDQNINKVGEKRKRDEIKKDEIDSKKKLKKDIPDEWNGKYGYYGLLPTENEINERKDFCIKQKIISKGVEFFNELNNDKIDDIKEKFNININEIKKSKAITSSKFDLKLGSKHNMLPSIELISSDKPLIKYAIKDMPTIPPKNHLLRNPSKIPFMDLGNYFLKALNTKHKKNKQIKKLNARMNGPPVIIVPSSLTSVINLANSQKFLQDSEWIPGNKSPKLGRSTQIEIEHTFKNDKTLKFIISNNHRLFKRDQDWNRLVCVFASGQEYQFKGWKWDNSADIFQHSLGFHLKYDDNRVDDKIKKLNVRILNISKTKRHSDAVVRNQFWSDLEEWLLIHKPELFE